jgi:hypothetical protein
MQKLILPALLLSLLTFSLACDSCDKDDTVIVLPTFTGFSLTDDNGQALSNPDSTDWRVDDSWEQVEKDLFGSPGLPLCTGDGEVSPAFPNSCSSVLGFRFVSTTNTTGYFRVVDKDFKVLLEANAIPFEAGAKIISLNFSEINPDTVRLYYRIVGNNCEYRGHGDVIVQ